MKKLLIGIFAAIFLTMFIAPQAMAWEEDWRFHEYSGIRDPWIGKNTTFVTTEGTEYTFDGVGVENDEGEEAVGYVETVELDDETNATEDVIVRKYMMVGGTLGLVYANTAYAAAPSSFVAGCQVIADNDNWDPCDVAGTDDYWTFYDGSAWRLMAAEFEPDANDVLSPRTSGTATYNEWYITDVDAGDGSTAYTISMTYPHEIYRFDIDAISNDYTVNLPEASTVPGNELIIYLTNADASNDLLADPDDADQFLGGAAAGEALGADGANENMHLLFVTDSTIKILDADAAAYPSGWAEETP